MQQATPIPRNLSLTLSRRGPSGRGFQPIRFAPSSRHTAKKLLEKGIPPSMGCAGDGLCGHETFERGRALARLPFRPNVIAPSKLQRVQVKLFRDLICEGLQREMRERET